MSFEESVKRRNDSSQLIGLINGGDDWNKFFKVDDSNAEQKTQFYTKNAETYDQSMAEHRYHGPKLMAQRVHEYFSERKNAGIIFVPAGTGNEITQLQRLAGKERYTNITGLDGSEGMLAVLRQKQITNQEICCMFVPNCPISNDTYDAVVSVGGFVPGHLTVEALPEMCRIIKPGGLLMVMMREAYIYESVDYNSNKLFNELDKLENSGRMERIRREVIPGYYNDLTGMEFLYRKL